MRKPVVVWLTPLIILATASCGSSIESIVAKDFDRASRTADLCSKHMPGATDDPLPTSLLDVEHDLRARMGTLLGDPRPALAQVADDMEHDLIAVVGKTGEKAPTLDGARDASRAQLEKLLGSKLQETCIEDPSTCPWGTERRDNDPALSREILAMRALELNKTIVDSFDAAATIATFLDDPAPISATSTKERWSKYQRKVEVLLGKLTACMKAKDAKTAAGGCRKGIDDLLTLEQRASIELRRFEKAAKLARETFIKPESAPRLDALVGRYRRHVLLLADGAAAARAVRDGAAADFLALMGQRDGRLVARLAFRTIRGGLADLNHRIDRLDDKLYGALTIGSTIGGDAVNNLIESAVARVGKDSATLLKRLHVAPEPVMQEACNALLEETSRESGLLRMDAVYEGILRGLDEHPKATTLPASDVARTGDSARPAASVTTGAFGVEAFHAAALTGWSTELSYQIAHGAEDNPPLRPLSDDLVSAFYEELLRRPDLLRAALAPAGRDTDGAFSAGAPRATDPLDVRIAGEVTTSVLLRLENRTSASIDTTGLAQQIEALVKAQQPALKSNADIVEAMGQMQGTISDAQTVNSMCAVLNDSPMLRARRVDARCVNNAPGNAIASIELSGRLPPYGPRPGLFEPGSFWLAKPLTSKDKQRVDELNESLTYVGRTLNRIAAERPQMRFSIRVEGFASASSFMCDDLAKQAEVVVPKCLEALPVGGTCFGPEGRLRIDGSEVTWPTGENACAPESPRPAASPPEAKGAKPQPKGGGVKPKSRDGNATLALLRAYTVARKLREVVCEKQGNACAWKVDPEVTLVVGRGDESNQTVRVYIQQRRE